MKRLLFIVLTLLFCITSFAEEKKIKLEKDGKDKDKRTFTAVPKKMLT